MFAALCEPNEKLNDDVLNVAFFELPALVVGFGAATFEVFCVDVANVPKLNFGVLAEWKFRGN